ncbi:MAG TPA: hypothetical protein VJM50_17140, partial [Pyrinomonadaceae bacterium]|nr:hypothetical protein [Pyrinomonadaceae bacterium]
MATVDDGLVDSPFGRVRPEILDILNGGQGATQPAPTNEAAQVAAPEVEPQGINVESEPVDPNALSSHIGRATDRLQADVGGLGEAVGEAFGSQPLAQAGAQYRQQQLEEASQYGTPENASAFDVDINDPESIGSYLKGIVAGATPALGTTAGAAYTGSKIGSMFGPKGKVAGGLAGAFLASFGINAGEFQNEVKELDPTKQGGWSSLAFGAGTGAVDTFALGKLVSPLLKWVPESVVFQRGVQAGFSPVSMRQAIGEAAMGFGKGALVEGSTEALQEGSQAYLTSKVADHQLDPDKLYSRLVDASLGGALVGGGVRSGSNIINSVVENAHAIDTAHEGKTFAEGNTKEGGFLTKLWQLGGSAATESLIPLARVSPEIESLVREFRPDMSGEKATGKTAFEDADIMAGTWNEQLNGFVKGKSDQELAQLLDSTSLPKDQLTGDSLKLRNLLDQVPNTATTKGGISDVGYVDGYMPFSLDPAKVKARSQEFLTDIAPFMQDPVKATTDWLQEVETPRGSTVPEIDQLVKPNATTGELEIMMRSRKAGDPDTMRAK